MLCLSDRDNGDVLFDRSCDGSAGNRKLMAHAGNVQSQSAAECKSFHAGGALTAAESPRGRMPCPDKETRPRIGNIGIVREELAQHPAWSGA